MKDPTIIFRGNSIDRLEVDKRGISYGEKQINITTGKPMTLAARCRDSDNEKGECDFVFI